MLFSVPFGGVLKGIGFRRLSLPSSAPRIQIPKLDLQFLPFPVRCGAVSEITSTWIMCEVTGAVRLSRWAAMLGGHVGAARVEASRTCSSALPEAGQFEQGSVLLTHHWLLFPAQQRRTGLPGPRGEVCREKAPAVALQLG